MATGTDAEPLPIKSVGTVFNVIEHLRTEGTVSVTALATDLSMAKSTAHAYLSSLQQRGYAVKDDDGYRLSLRFLDLGDRARSHHGLYDRVKPEVDELAAVTGERVQLMVQEESAGVYIYQTQGERAVQTDSHVGTTVALHATAVGKAYLAFLPEERVLDILDASGQSPLTEFTVTDRDALLAELVEIRERGYALNMEERIKGMRAVGAPIRDDEGTSIAAISVSGPTTRLNGDRLTDELPKQIGRAARVIEIKSTYP
ncbi:IclR family transcriptional regulator [Haloferacaceae archaeon DSL9]